MKPIVLDVLKMHERVVAAHSTIWAVMYKVSEHAKAKTLSSEEMTDIVFALRKMREMFHDLRKEADELRELLDRLICLEWMDEATGESIRGEVATGSPDCSIGAKVPSMKSEPEAYLALMLGLGIPEQVVVDDIVRPHWPGLSEYLTRLAEKGEPMPRGIDPKATFTKFTVKTVKRSPKELSEIIKDHSE